MGKHTFTVFYNYKEVKGKMIQLQTDQDRKEVTGEETLSASWSPRSLSVSQHKYVRVHIHLIQQN